MRYTFTTLVVIGNTFVGLMLSCATAQTANELVGTWTLVSSIARYGSIQVDAFGANPSGTLILGSDRRYALVFLRGDLPRITSNDRTFQTPHESRAIGQGVIAHFRTYTIVKAEKVLVLQIENSSFPNWKGSELRRAISLKGDDLIYTSPGSTGVATQVTL